MNYNYTSIKLIDGKIKAVVNRQTEPISFFDLEEWQQNHEVFEFANQDEKMKVLDSLNDHDELDNGIEVTCIEIKCESCGYNISDKLKEGAIGCCPDGYYKAWFKEEKEEESEFILCAANYYDDGLKETHTVSNIDTGFVICGRRHHNCISIFAKMYGFPYSDEARKIQHTEIQGFITNTNKFVTRLEALEIARKSKQIITGEGNSILGLFSEDLY